MFSNPNLHKNVETVGQVAKEAMHPTRLLSPVLNVGRNVQGVQNSIDISHSIYQEPTALTGPTQTGYLTEIITRCLCSMKASYILH